MPTQIILVRHGHNRWVPDEMRALSERGQADAARIVPLLAGVAVDAVYASPYTRAWQTVAPLAADRGLAIQQDAAWRERELGEIGDLAFEVAAKRAWDEPDFAFPRGESQRAAQARGLAALRALVARHAGGTVVVGGHGTLLSLICQGLDPRYGYEFWAAMSMPDVYRLTFSGDRFVGLERLWTEA